MSVTLAAKGTANPSRIELAVRLKAAFISPAFAEPLSTRGIGRLPRPAVKSPPGPRGQNAVAADEELGLIVEASAIVHTPGSHVVRVFTLRTLHHGVTDLNDVA